MSGANVFNTARPVGSTSSSTSRVRAYRIHAEYHLQMRASHIFTQMQRLVVEHEPIMRPSVLITRLPRYGTYALFE